MLTKGNYVNYVKIKGTMLTVPLEELLDGIILLFLNNFPTSNV